MFSALISSVWFSLYHNFTAGSNFSLRTIEQHHLCARVNFYNQTPLLATRYWSRAVAKIFSYDHFCRIEWINLIIWKAIHHLGCENYEYFCSIWCSTLKHLQLTSSLNYFVWICVVCIDWSVVIYLIWQSAWFNAS